MSNFEKALKDLINSHSIENESNTPDWLLAQYLIGCLAIFTKSIRQREIYYGRDLRPILEIESEKVVYGIHIICGNCLHEQILEVKKSNLRPDDYLCDNCGCVSDTSRICSG